MPTSARTCPFSPREADAAGLSYLCRVGIIWKSCFHKSIRMCAVSSVSLRRISEGVVAAIVPLLPTAQGFCT